MHKNRILVSIVLFAGLMLAGWYWLGQRMQPPASPAPEQAALPPKAESTGEKVREKKPVRKEPRKNLAAVKETPTFDAVNIDPDGMSVFAGRSSPDAEVTVHANGRPIGTTKADEFGEWTMVVEHKFAAGQNRLKLSSRFDGKAMPVSGQVVTVAVQKRAGKPAHTAAVKRQKPAETVIKRNDTGAPVVTGTAPKKKIASVQKPRKAQPDRTKGPANRRTDSESGTKPSGDGTTQAVPPKRPPDSKPSVREVTDGLMKSLERKIAAARKEQTRREKTRKNQASKEQARTPVAPATSPAVEFAPGGTEPVKPAPPDIAAPEVERKVASLPAKQTPPSELLKAKPSPAKKDPAPQVAMKAPSVQAKKKPVFAPVKIPTRVDNTKTKPIAEKDAAPGEKTLASKRTPAVTPTDSTRDQGSLSVTSTKAATPAAPASVESVPVPIKFIYLEANFTVDGKKAAALLLEYVKLKNFKKIVLSGHADERGTHQFNLELSRERLETVARYLRDGGFKGELVLIPKGETEPFTGVERSAYSREDLFQLDRRVELRVRQ